MAKKNHTLLAMLAGAALAGGFLYMKKLNEQSAEPAPEGAAPDGEDAGTDYGWKATFTDETGKEIPADEATAELKQEAAKALNEFKETAKAAGAELLTGLKKAYEEMKAAVADAQTAAAERRAEMAEEGETCEAVDEALEEAKEDVKEAFEDVKEACCEKAEEVKEAAEEAVEEIKEKVEE